MMSFKDWFTKESNSMMILNSVSNYLNYVKHERYFKIGWEAIEKQYQERYEKMKTCGNCKHVIHLSPPHPRFSCRDSVGLGVKCDQWEEQND